MKNKGDWMLLLAAAIGGGGFIGIKYLLDWGYSPYHVIFGRFLVAASGMGVFYFRQIPQITRQEWKTGGLLGAMLAAMFLLLTIGLQYTTPSVNAFLTNTPAVIVPFICWAVFGKRPSLSCFFAAGMTGVGVALLSLTADFRVDLGAVLSLGAAVAFSLQMAFLGNMAEECDAIHIALVENIAVLAIGAAAVLLAGRGMPPLTLPAIGDFIFLGAFCTALYFVLQSIGQRETPPSKAAIIITSESIFAAVASAIFYGERMSVRGLCGCVLIFLAMLLAEKK